MAERFLSGWHGLTDAFGHRSWPLPMSARGLVVERFLSDRRDVVQAVDRMFITILLIL